MISKRLTMILGLVQPCHVLADIGTDHGYLALEALQTKVTQRVIAADVRSGPLKQAQKTFAEANVFENVSYVLSDGLREVPDPVDCAVIGGMGADVILKIITQDLNRFRCIPQIIVQANTKHPLLRARMAELGFEMRDEHIVLDGFYYIAQRYVYTDQKEEISDFQINFGRFLSLNDPIYQGYLNNELARIRAILRSHPNSQKHLALIDLLKTRLDERVDWIVFFWNRVIDRIGFNETDDLINDKFGCGSPGGDRHFMALIQYRGIQFA